VRTRITLGVARLTYAGAIILMIWHWSEKILEDKLSPSPTMTLPFMNPKAAGSLSANWFLARLASVHRKPHGLFVVTPDMGPSFVETLSVGKFHSVGRVTAGKMNTLAVHSGLDLRRQIRAF
jgi:hypothetical protein